MEITGGNFYYLNFNLEITRMNRRIVMSKALVYEVLEGQGIDYVLYEMIELAVTNDRDVKADINGIVLIANPVDTYAKLKRRYKNTVEGQFK